MQDGKTTLDKIRDWIPVMVIIAGLIANWSVYNTRLNALEKQFDSEKVSNSEFKDKMSDSISTIMQKLAALEAQFNILTKK